MRIMLSLLDLLAERFGHRRISHMLQPLGCFMEMA
jgi:hypothetical protein